MDTYSTEFFNKQAFKAIQKSIQIYNQKDFVKGISRQEAEYYNTKISPNSMKNLQLLKSTDDFANQLIRINKESIVEAKDKLAEIIQGEFSAEQKLIAIQALVLERQNYTNDLIIAGFTEACAVQVKDKIIGLGR